VARREVEEFPIRFYSCSGQGIQIIKWNFSPLKESPAALAAPDDVSRKVAGLHSRHKPPGSYLNFREVYYSMY
jgi:hypothetical protein